jgi:peptide/nickel transport system permease protein
MSDAAITEKTTDSGVESRTRLTDFRRALFSNRLAVFGLVVMAAFAIIGVLAPLLAPYDPITDQDLSGKFAGPSAEHLLGQDELGRDILSRLIYGTRVSLTAGLAAVGVATVAGTLIGLTAGYAGRWVDAVLMRLMDVILAFPAILLAIVIVTILGRSLTNALLAVGIVYIPQMARVVRSAVISVREREYVDAERALGASHVHILRSTILPNSLAPLIVQATLTLAVAVLDVAALSFLGLGATAPTPEWGAMLTSAFRAGFGVFVEGQHAIVFPGIAIALAVLSVNFIGDGLRDAFDPKSVK